MADSTRHPQMPKPKGTTVIKFCLKDNPEETLDVIKEELTAHGLRTLKKRGYVQASKLLQELAKAAEPEEEVQAEPPTEDVPRTPGRARKA